MAARGTARSRAHSSRRRLGTVAGAVVGEERVAGALVDVDFDLLAARRGARSRSCVAELGRGVLVLGADRREQRAAELGRPARAAASGAAAVERSSGVARSMKPPQQSTAASSRSRGAGEQQRVAPAHAEADAADPPGHVRRARAGGRRRPRGRRARVASDIENRRAIIACMSPSRRRAAFARVQVDAERHVADVGEAVGRRRGCARRGRRPRGSRSSPGWLAGVGGRAR